MLGPPGGTPAASGAGRLRADIWSTPKWERIGFCEGAKDHVSGVVSASLSSWLQAVLEEDTGSGFCGWQSRPPATPALFC